MSRFILLLAMLGLILNLYCATMISQVQYVIDPGMPTEYTGNLSFSGTNPIQANYTLDLNSSPDGLHQILIRVKDNDGKWSQRTQRTIYKNTGTLSPISKLEYYFDTDPGPGNASPLSFSGSGQILFTGTINTSGITNGWHTLTLRSQNSQGQWSQNAQRKVFVSHPATVTLSSLKYCFDGDLSSVYTLPLSPISGSPGLWTHSSELIPPPALAPGIHALSLWTVNTIGKISHRSERVILLSPTQLSTINRFEWFLSGGEADPAVIHSHTVVEPLSDITELIRAVLPDLTPETEYKLYLTARSADGKESLRYIYTFEYAWMVENLVLTLNGNQFVLNWDEIPNADYYLLDSMSSPETVHSTVSVSSPPVIINPPHFQKRFFRVRAVMEE